MYNDYYGFKERPFNIVSDPELFYMSQKHGIALKYLEYGLMDGIGFILLTGEIGTGKTTLIKRMVKRVKGNVETAVLFNTNVTAHELIESILGELEQPKPPGGKASCLDALNQYLISRHAQGVRVLLIIDEAQNLPHDALEEIRMLSNLQTEKASLLQVILVGQPHLQDRLKHPSLMQLRQRIAVSYHLRPLTMKETINYIAYRIKTTGCNKEIFTESAIEKIYEHTGGVPRSINILCDVSLVYGFADEMRTIDAPVIDSVIEDRKKVGALDACCGQESVDESGGGQEGQNVNSDIESRFHALENQVSRLSAALEWQARESENRADSYRNLLVERLESMLREERAKTDKLLAQCNVLEDRLNRPALGSRGGSKKMPARERIRVAAKTSSSPTEGEAEKSGGDSGLLRKWFGKGK